jgi:polygalacturonase
VLTIDGILEAPATLDGSLGSDPFISIFNSQNVVVNGTGSIEGSGYDWWVREWKRENHNGRPNLLDMSRVQNVEISGVKFRNSPRYHISFDESDSIYIHDLEIEVDMLKQ